MGLKADNWIKRMALDEGMIDPFVEEQVEKILVRGLLPPEIVHTALLIHFLNEIMSSRLQFLLLRESGKPSRVRPWHEALEKGSWNAGHIDCAFLYCHTQVKGSDCLWSTTNVDIKLALPLFVDLVNKLPLKLSELKITQRYK